MATNFTAVKSLNFSQDLTGLNEDCKLTVVCFLLGNSLASGVYMPMFLNTVCSIFIGK